MRLFVAEFGAVPAVASFVFDADVNPDASKNVLRVEDCEDH